MLVLGYTELELLCEQSEHHKPASDTSLKDGFGLQSAAMLCELQSKLQLTFAFCLVGGSFLMLLRIICALSFFPVFLPSCSMRYSYLSSVFLFSLVFLLVLLLAA